MEERLNRPVAILSTKLIVGLFVTIVGLLLAADNLEVFEADRVLPYWPAVLVVIGLLKLPEPGQRVLGTILTIAGASLLAYNAGWIRFTIFDLWPLLLIGLGASMVGRAVGVRLPGGTGQNIWAILSTQKITNTSSEFSGADIVAFMLDPDRFVRIHRSYLLNIERLDKLELYAKDSHVAILREGARLPVSRSGYARLRELL